MIETLTLETRPPVGFYPPTDCDRDNGCNKSGNCILEGKCLGFAALQGTVTSENLDLLLQNGGSAEEGNAIGIADPNTAQKMGSCSRKDADCANPAFCGTNGCMFA